MAAQIVVVGSINMDLVTRAKIPVPGETVIGGDLRAFPGGKGANQAVAAARLGASVAMVGRVGHDVFADRLLDNLAAAGVDLTHVSRDKKAATGVALIVVDDSGQNSIVVASGANAKIKRSAVDAAVGAIRAAKVLILQLEIPLNSVIHAARLARVNGVKVILNPAPAQPLPTELLKAVDILIPNENETALLSGLPANTPAEFEAAATELLLSGVGAVILTLGDKGTLLAQRSGFRRFPAFSVEQVVDTTAAGDAFVGGLATAIAQGKTLTEAVLWGNAAGALTVTRLGAQPSLPSRADLVQLLAMARAEHRNGVPAWKDVRAKRGVRP